jgi:hypothetical protein
MNQDQLENLVEKKNLEIFWAGPRSGYLYTLDASDKSSLLIRYIKENSDGKDTAENSRVVATYRSGSAFENSVAAASLAGNTGFRNPDGSVVFYSLSNDTAIYLAYPKKKVQIEIFDPVPGQALSLAILHGQISEVGK